LRRDLKKEINQPAVDTETRSDVKLSAAIGTTPSGLAEALPKHTTHAHSQILA